MSTLEVLKPPSITFQVFMLECDVTPTSDRSHQPDFHSTELNQTKISHLSDVRVQRLYDATARIRQRQFLDNSYGDRWIVIKNNFTGFCISKVHICCVNWISLNRSDQTIHFKTPQWILMSWENLIVQLSGISWTKHSSIDHKITVVGCHTRQNAS